MKMQRMCLIKFPLRSNLNVHIKTVQETASDTPQNHSDESSKFYGGPTKSSASQVMQTEMRRVSKPWQHYKKKLE